MELRVSRRQGWRSGLSIFLSTIFVVFTACTSLCAEDKLVSVVMTTYNREDLVLHAVDSILAQTYTNFELIIIDDASTDDSWNVLRNEIRDPRVRLFRLSQNVGMYAGSNYALKHLVRGEYVTWQDSDDTSHPERLQRQVEHLELNQLDAVSIAHQNLRTGLPTYNDFPSVQDATPAQFPLRRFSRSRSRFGFSMTRGLFRTSRVLEIGGFDGRRRISMDAHFVERFIRMFRTGALNDEPLYFYNPREDSLTIAAATAHGSPARNRVRNKILADRCASWLLWHAGARSTFNRYQKQDLYYPEGVTAEEGFPVRLSAAG